MSVFSQKILIVTGLVMIFSRSAMGEVVFQESRLWRRAKLVSSGQQVWSFQSSYQKASDRYSRTGRVESMGTKYARAVTWDQLLKAEKSAQGRADMETYMKARGVKSADIAATSTYKVEREDVGFSVDWAYGLTRNWMIGFQVPLLLRTTRVSSHVEMTPFLAQGVGQRSQRSVLGLDNGQVRSKVKDLAEQELANSGYDNIPDENRSWEWGDASLLSQFYLARGYRWQWALQQMVRFPTSRDPSVSDYLQQASDDGQMDMGLTSLADYRFRRWTLGGRLGFVAQLPDSAKMRTESDSVSSEVHRDLGDWVWGALDADYRFNRKLGLELEYVFLKKGKDKYKGHLVSAENTDQEIHQTRCGLTYELAATSSRRGIEKKWVASLGYTQPWLGRNSVDAGKAAFELTTYF